MSTRGQVVGTRPPAVPPPARHWGAGRIITVIVSSLLAMTSLGLVVAGGMVRLADVAFRDSDGYLTSSTMTLGSSGYAVTSEGLDLGSGTSWGDLSGRWLGEVRVRARNDAGGPVFVGIGRTSEVSAYLAGVARSEVVDPTGNDGAPAYVVIGGGAPDRPPAGAGVWAASASGPRQQTLTWEASSGSWTIVVMNADAGAPVAADVSVGAEAPVLRDLALALLGAGLLLLVVSVTLLVLALRTPRHTPRAATPDQPGSPVS